MPVCFLTELESPAALVARGCRVSVLFEDSLVITYTEHLQEQFIKRAFMGFGKAFLGTAERGPRSLYLQIKTFSY